MEYIPSGVLGLLLVYLIYRMHRLERRFGELQRRMVDAEEQVVAAYPPEVRVRPTTGSPQT